VVIQKEDLKNLREGAHWMAVVKVHTIKHFSNQPFFEKMDFMWDFAQKWKLGLWRAICLFFKLLASANGTWRCLRGLDRSKDRSLAGTIQRDRGSKVGNPRPRLYMGSNPRHSPAVL
jgi:hypothetical protein